MKTLVLPVLLTATVFASTNALADHNSKWGEGWARMPNDIHNTRIDTLGDNTAFRDFVRYGNGADSVNRYASSSHSGRMLGGGSSMGGGRGR